MNMKLLYSFDDEPVSKFCYDIRQKAMAIYFEGYYDIEHDTYKAIPCLFTIEQWAYAKIKVGHDVKLYDLDSQIGIFKMILYMKYNNEDELEMLANTVDNRYLTIFLKSPQLRLSLR